MSDARATSSELTVAIVGRGQLGELVAAGLDAVGCSVRWIVRATPETERDATLDAADRVLVAVGEDDLAGVLTSLPSRLRHRGTWLLQNELLPETWRAAHVTDPTVMVVWSEKKQGQPVKVVQTTLVGGPDHALLTRALIAAAVPAQSIENDALEDALIDKNLYILTSNLAGIRVGGTVGALARDHHAWMTEVASEVLAVESARVGRPLALDGFLPRLLAAFEADPEHACRGRSAPARLARTLSRAAAHGVATPAIAALHGAR